MNEPPVSDAFLMSQVSLGHRDCLEDLIRRHADALMGYLFRLCRDRHLSEDLFQETFLRVWKKRKQYRYPNSVRSWIFTIALNLCRSHFRGRNLTVVPLEEDMTFTQEDPDERLIAREDCAVLYEGVSTLTDSQRSVLELRIWAGLSYAEIATVMNRGETTVRSHMFYALAALRKFMKSRLQRQPERTWT